MDVAEGIGARRKKFSCSVREIFLHGAAGDSARGVLGMKEMKEMKRNEEG